MDRADSLILEFLNPGLGYDSIEKDYSSSHPQVGFLTLHTDGSPDHSVHHYHELMMEEGEETKPINRTFGRLGVGWDAKTVKGQKKGYLTGIMYLTPAGFGGMPNLCGNESPGCKASCLFYSGRLGMGRGKAQLAKTKDYVQNRRAFIDKLDTDIHKVKTFAKKRNFKLAVRLNGTSDIPWEKSGLMEKHPDVRFYDYTKHANRVHNFIDGKLPKNYHLSFSLDERPESYEHAKKIMARGHNVVVPFSIQKGHPLPKTWRGKKVLDGDVTDHRFMDRKGGHWIGLRMKSGPGRHDTTGFIVRDPHLEP